MKTIKDLYALIKTGKTPIVTFGEKIVQQDEAYADPGMRARIVAAQDCGDDLIQLTFDYQEFEGHNIPLERAEYHSRGGSLQTAHQAGRYQSTDYDYFNVDELLEDLIIVESGEVVALFAAYQSEKSGLTYLQWLEAKVLSSPR